EKQRAEPVRFHPLPRALQPVLAQARPVDPLLPIDPYHPEVRHLDLRPGGAIVQRRGPVRSRQLARAYRNGTSDGSIAPVASVDIDTPPLPGARWPSQMARGRSGTPKAEIYDPRVVLGAASPHGTGASVPRNPQENRAVDWSGRQDLKV